MATTHTSNHCCEVADIGHSKLQNNTTGHRKWEFFIGFCNMETVKMTSMMCNNLFKAGSYTDGLEIPCVYGY
jgi:hypothetical protein